jgi:Fe-S cluster assembly iron-binding protein IscA
LEPAIYCQIPLSKLFRVEMGASYRYIWGTNLPYISDSNLSGFSFHVGFLVSACKCN